LSLYLIHDVSRESSLVKCLDRLGNLAAGNRDGVVSSELVDLGLRSLSHLGMLLVERLLELWENTEIPLLLLKTSAEIVHAVTTSSIAAAATTTVRVAVRASAKKFSSA
jgi:hypothetical protein